MSCDLCRSSQKDEFEGYKDLNCAGIDTTEICRKIGKAGFPVVPKLSQENKRFIDGFFSRVAPGLFKSSGDYDYGPIQLAFNIYGIRDTSQRKYLMDKCLVMIAAHSEARRKKG
jgi:hypothetical protein